MPYRPRARRRPVGLTSLIDVIFLLLLFFMLASSFTRYQSLDVSSGAAGGGADLKPAYLRIHTADILDLNGSPLMKTDLVARLSGLKENAVIAIWSGPEAHVQDVVDVMSAARRTGLRTVLVTGN
ncbi:ExbD/TolR family protein [Roseibium sediminicola]|uniref:Biopolymer transporter ExbD n=1 Tax=Roseibium sediminicola TaxID=2933272 RepID=A0ABT0GY60_9HYPH|nr:biopolymer transporter ExbD [Roseibium sp. CAU 1639]MCK7613753.1 biopolymer transporter ExbD [Roseibium sp. CAU 1639]